MIHTPIDFENCEHLIEGWSKLVPINFDELAEFNVFSWGVSVDFDCVDDGVQHVKKGAAVGVFWFWGGEVGVYPHFQLILLVDS